MSTFIFLGAMNISHCVRLRCFQVSNKRREREREMVCRHVALIIVF